MFHWIKTKFKGKEDRVALLSVNRHFEDDDVDLMQGAKSDAKRLYIRNDILGYKVVCVVDNDKSVHYGMPVSTKALLTLQITGNIYESMHGKEIVHPGRDLLQPSTKYCTNRLIVLGVQFIGSTESVYEAIKGYQRGKKKLASGFAGGNQFSYEVEQTHVEPRAGKNGCGCYHGLHFFTSKEKAVRYYGEIDGREVDDRRNTKQIIITKRLQNGRGLVIHTDEDDRSLKRSSFCQAYSRLSRLWPIQRSTEMFELFLLCMN